MKADRPKQLLALDGTPILVYTLRKFDSCPAIDHIIVPSPHEFVDEIQRLVAEAGLKKRVIVVEGGELPRVRQLAIEQQPRGFLEARMFSEIVDGIAAVAQVARPAVDERARRAIEVDAFQAAVNLDCFGCFGH